MQLSTLVSLAAVVCLAGGPAAAQETASDTLLTVKHYLNFEGVADPRLSPDGRQIVYTRRWVNQLEDKWDTALWIMDADGARNRFLVEGSDARWSPDGTRIAYLIEVGPKTKQIAVLYLGAGGSSTQITRVEQSPQDLRWSPDGKHVGFVMLVPKASPWKIDMPEPPKDGKWTAAPRIVQSLHYREDRKGFLEPGLLQLFQVPADGGTPAQITKGDWGVGARFDMLTQKVKWDWVPDGKTILVDGYDSPDADLKNFRNSHILAVDVATGRSRRLTKEEGRWVDPTVSPDGRSVAFSGYPGSRASYQARSLYLMSPDGSNLRKLSGDLDRDPEELTWSPDSKGVYFTARDRGSMNLLFAPREGGVHPITTGNQMIVLGSVASTGVAAVVRSAPQEPPDVYRINLRGKGGTPIQLTHVNDDALSGIRLGGTEELWVGSSGGTRVQGWLVKPPGFDRTKRYPLIIEIHGGPHAMYDVGFSYMFQNFAANGFVVLYINPRGSTGYGSAFGNAIERAYPGVDYDDLMAAVDTVVGRGYVDPAKMFVGGCSGGGVLSSWVIGRTQRFAAAAVRCPVMNWISMAGTSDIPFFTHQWFATPFWENPEPWLRQSPIMYVNKITTPTVVMTGELDLRTPMPQSEELYTALLMRGVPAALIRFEGEFHGTGSKPSNFMRTQLYMMSWYKRWADSARTNAAAAQ